MKINKSTITYIFLPLVAVASIYLAASGSLPIIAQSNDGVKQAHKQNGIEVAGSVVVTDKPKQVLDYAKGKGLKPNFSEEGRGPRAKIVALDELPSDPKVEQLSEDLDVEIKPDYVYKATFEPNDPKYSDQWNLEKIKAPKAWDISRGSSDVTIAIVDSGILSEQTIDGTTYSQPDFPSGSIWTNPGEIGMTEAGDPCWNGTPEDKKTNWCDDDENGKRDDWQGWDFMGGFRGSSAACPNHNDPSTYESSSDSTFVEQDNDPQPYACDSPTSPSTLNKNHYDGRCVAWESACYVGHGTMVGSVPSAAADNNKLIAGIDHNAKVMSVRVLDGYGYGTTARTSAGIKYAANNGADVINLSLGSSCDNESFTDSVMEDALDTAKSAGVVVVAASGNDGDNTICYPASSPSVMAIGASDENDNRIGYSSYSKNGKLDVVAPSEVPVANAPSNFINSNYYGSAGGTSLSTPHAAGVLALHIAMDGSLTPKQLKENITKTAFKVENMGGNNFTNKYGYGRLSAYQSLYIYHIQATDCDISHNVNSSSTSKHYAAGIVKKGEYLDSDRTTEFTTTITAEPNEKIYMCLKLSNTGQKSWNRNNTKLGTAGKKDRASVFHDNSWLSGGRIARINEASVASGASGVFEFTLKAPNEVGTYIEKFNGLVEGKSWFNSKNIKYRINVVDPVVASNTVNINLEPGEELKPGEFLLSPDRHTTLVLRGNGNLVLRTHLKKVWSSNTKGHKAKRLVMQSDGNLVLYAKGGIPLWHTGTNGNGGANLKTQTDGNLVIFKDDSPLWSTDTVHRPDNLKMVNDITSSTSFMYQGQIMQSANRKLRLVLQTDGNLVLYASGKGAIWATGTDGKNVERLALQGDGNLVLYAKGGKPIWHTNTSGKGSSKLVTQADGNLVLYKKNGTPIWHTKTHGVL